MKALRDPANTLMHQEAGASADVLARQFAANEAVVQALATRLRARAPRAVVTCARGSSDHAATYAKYLIETRAGVLTASAAPSVASVYGVSQDLRDCLFIAISQSGQSPDLLASVEQARRSGAWVLALCNVPDAPLCMLADECLPLRAGPERSVAATKSWIATLGALAQLVSAWAGDAQLVRAVQELPAQLASSWSLDWNDALPLLQPAQHLYVIGRGIGLALAQEAALKAKETCGLHAEAFSSAEVRHGPFALLGRHFPALLLAQDDATRVGLEGLARELAARGVPVMAAGCGEPPVVRLPTLTMHPVTAPIALAASTYRLFAALSVLRGLDPDQPPHLRKVTETT